MSLLLSFMHDVCYITSVHLCSERSELSQTVWLILFLNTLTVGSPVMSRAQTSALLGLLTIDARSFLFLFPYGHIFFLMTDCWWTGNLLFLTPCTRRIPSSAGFAGIAGRFQLKWVVLFPCLFDMGLTFLSPGRDQNREEVTRKSTMANYTVNVSFCNQLVYNKDLQTLTS